MTGKFGKSQILWLVFSVFWLNPAMIIAAMYVSDNGYAAAMIIGLTAWVVPVALLYAVGYVISILLKKLGTRADQDAR